MLPRPLVLLIVLIMIMASLPFATSSGDAEDVWDYPGKYKDITDFDNSDASSYGAFLLTTTTHGSASISSARFYTAASPYSSPQYTTNGSHSARLTYDDGDALVDGYAKYTFRSFGPSLSPPISMKDLSIDVMSVPVGLSNGSVGFVQIRGYSENSAGNVVYSQSYVVPDDWEFHTYVFDEIYSPSAKYYVLEVLFGIDGQGSGWTVYLDHMTAEAPPCDVRFSFYNEYTGLGLNSELLVPEVWYDGIWQRVYDGHVVLGAGGYITWRVSDYFGQIFDMGPVSFLNASAYYIDVSVPLVKVNIAKPLWWDSSLPPEWNIIYLSTGKSVNVTGWELEVLAGWYSFEWDTQELANNSEEIVEVLGGASTQYITGNASSSRSYSMTNFFLEMSPTISGRTDNGNISMISPSLYTWEGLAAAFQEFVDQFTTSWDFKFIMFIGAMSTAVTIFAVIKRSAKKVVE